MDDPRRALLDRYPPPHTVEVEFVDLASLTPTMIGDGLLFVTASWSGVAKARFFRLTETLARVGWRGRLLLGDTDDIRDPSRFAEQFGVFPGGRGETAMVCGGKIVPAGYRLDPRALDE